MSPAPADLGEVEIVILDLDGTIVGVNAPWTDFCLGNGGDPAFCGPGTSYLAVCSAGADHTSQQITAALRW